MSLCTMVDRVDLPASATEVWSELIAELSGGRRWWTPSNTFTPRHLRPDLPGAITDMAVHPKGVDGGGPTLRFTARTRTADPGRLLVLDYVGGCFAGTGTLRLTPAPDGGTRLEFEFVAEPRGIARVLGRVVDLGVEHSRGTRAAWDRLSLRLTDAYDGAGAGGRAVGEHTAGGDVRHEGRFGVTDARQRALRVLTDDEANLFAMVAEPEAHRPTEPAVLLLHGWASEHTSWLPVAHRLVAAGVPVVLADLRGHGNSTTGRHPISIGRLAADARAVAGAAGFDHVVVAGHSGGGLVALDLALARDRVDGTVDETVDGTGSETPLTVHGVVLAGTAIRGDAATVAEVGVQSSRLLSAVLRRRALAERVLSRTMGPSGPIADRAEIGRTFAATPLAVRADFFSLTRYVSPPDLTSAQYPPIVVIEGGEDAASVPGAVAHTADLLPDATLVQLPGRGHALPLEDPDELARQALRLVRRAASPEHPARSADSSVSAADLVKA